MNFSKFLKIFDFFKFWVFSKFSCFLKNFMFWKKNFFFEIFYFFYIFHFWLQKFSVCIDFGGDVDFIFKIKTMLSINFEVCIFCKQRPDVMLYRSWLWGKIKRMLRVESCFGNFLCYWRGWARTQTPTTRNCTVELPTFAVIAGVSPIWVQWKSLTLEETPLWSDLLPRQVSMLFPAKICKYAT